jgi:hypothetical protein
MTRAEQRRASGIFLGAMLLFVAWYSYAADYSYRALSGTYVLQQGTSRDVLTLHADQTFTEDATGCFNHGHSEGTWRRL